MQQIINITNARNNLSQLISEVAAKETEVVIIRDSIPEAVLLPYSRFSRIVAEKEDAWKLRFGRLMEAGRRTGRQWARKRGLKLEKLTESSLYDLVKKA